MSGDALLSHRLQMIMTGSSTIPTLLRLNQVEAHPDRQFRETMLGLQVRQMEKYENLKEQAATSPYSAVVVIE